MPLQSSTLFLTFLIHLLAVLNDVDASTESDALDLERGLRLTGGASDLDGVIELYRDGSWWLVCDDWFDVKDATVICRMVGGADGVPMLFMSDSNRDSNPYEMISGTFGYSFVECTGAEDNIRLCPYKRKFNCNDDEQVAVKCHGKGGAQWTHPTTTRTSTDFFVTISNPNSALKTQSTVVATQSTVVTTQSTAVTMQSKVVVTEPDKKGTTGSLTTGSLTTGSLTTGSLTTGSLTTGSLTTGSLTTGSLTTAHLDAEQSDDEEASMATPVLIAGGVLAAILTAAGAGLASMLLGRRKRGSESSSSPGSSMSGSSDWSESV